MRLRFACVVVCLGASPLACSGSGSTPQDAGTDAPAVDASGAVTVTVTPAPANLLTCTTTKFAAAVAGTTDTAVAWGVAPSPAGGAIAQDGTYTSPMTVPSPATATVTATSHANPTISGSAQVTLATVHPGAPSVLPLAAGSDTEQYHHRVAISGSYGYAVRSHLDTSSGKDSIQVSVSSNGGATWGQSKNIFDADPAAVTTACAAVAVDPGDPKTAYVVYYDTGAGCTSATSTGNDSRWVLAVTKDGGGTFTHHVLADGATACPDVVAPSPGHVVVSGAGRNSNDANMTFFSSAVKGDDLDAPSACPANAIATNTTAFDMMYTHIGVNGGSGYGEEAPRLFTDGKGNTCIAFEGYLPSPAAAVDVPWVSCSKDGVTWSTPVQISTDTSSDAHLTQGAFGAGGELTVAWIQEDGSGASSATVRFATSPGLDTSGAPKAFGTPQKRPQFVIPESSQNAVPQDFTLVYEGDTLFVAAAFGTSGIAHVVVDKTCDPAQAIWSGAVVVNAPAGGASENQFDMDHPALQLAKGSLNVFVYHPSTSQVAQVALEP